MPGQHLRVENFLWAIFILSGNNQFPEHMWLVIPLWIPPLNSVATCLHQWKRNTSVLVEAQHLIWLCWFSVIWRPQFVHEYRHRANKSHHLILFMHLRSKTALIYKTDIRGNVKFLRLERPFVSFFFQGIAHARWTALLLGWGHSAGDFCAKHKATNW